MDAKFLTPIFHDVLEVAAKTETQDFIEQSILRPILQRILRHLYPYILGVMTLWILMFFCLALILIVLVRGTTLDSIFVLRK